MKIDITVTKEEIQCRFMLDGKWKYLNPIYIEPGFNSLTAYWTVVGGFVDRIQNPRSVPDQGPPKDLTIDVDTIDEKFWRE